MSQNLDSVSSSCYVRLQVDQWNSFDVTGHWSSFFHLSNMDTQVHRFKHFWLRCLYFTLFSQAVINPLSTAHKLSKILLQAFWQRPTVGHVSHWFSPPFTDFLFILVWILTFWCSLIEPCMAKRHNTFVTFHTPVLWAVLWGPHPRAPECFLDTFQDLGNSCSS